MDNQDHFGFKIGRDRSTITGLNILRFGAEERKNLLQSPIDTPNGVEEVHLPQKYQQQKVPTIVVNDHNEIAEHSCQLVSNSHWEYKKVNGVEKIEIGMANNNLSRSDSRQRNKPVRDNNFNLENKSHKVVLNSLSDVDTTRSEEDLVKTAQTQERLSLDRVSVVTKKDYRKYSLPSDLSWDSKQVRDMNKPLGAEQLSEPDVLFKHRQSVFGDMGLDDSYSPGDRCATDSGFKEQLFSFFQATDNKLALKLYGSKSAVQKEKRRQQQAHACIIHPCSNFRQVLQVLS